MGIEPYKCDKEINEVEFHKLILLEHLFKGLEYGEFTKLDVERFLKIIGIDFTFQQNKIKEE